MQRGGRRLPAFALIIAAVTVIWAAVPGTAIRAHAVPSAPGQSGTADAAGAEKNPSWTVTLVTGDVVRLSGEPGKQSAKVVTDAEPGMQSADVVTDRQARSDVSITVIGEDVYAVPSQAVPMLAAGQLDMSLFDLTLLARDGYADESGPELPVLVTYKSDTEASAAESGRRLAGATVVRHLPSVQGLAARVDHKHAREFFDSITDPAASLSGEGMGSDSHGRASVARPELAKVWLDGKMKASLDTSRPAIGTDKAWAAGYAGAGATVAVLDTGIDEGHPDLAGQVVDKQSFVKGKTARDGHGHGTHVAGTIAGTGAASGGKYAGVAPKAKLAIGKVLGDDGAGQWSDVIAGMEWAAGKAKVVNMSLGGGPSDGTDPVSQALNDISRRTGALFVVAAGNAGKQYEADPITGYWGNRPHSIATPGSADLALTVGAVYKPPEKYAGETASFSSIGPRSGDFAIKPEISAPGVDVKAPRAAGTFIGDPVAGYGDRYAQMSGTSMATPHVAGSAAILLSRHPDWNAQQIRDALTSAAALVRGPQEPHSPIYYQGAGNLDVGRAVTQSVRATGILNLGIAKFPQQPGAVLEGDVTYTNTGPGPVTLTLSAEFSQAPEDFLGRTETVWTPPLGAVSIPGEVTVPAGGSQTVRVRVDLASVPYGTVFGRIKAASADGATVARTTLGLTREPETRQLRMHAIDRTGQPITTTGWSYGWLLDLEHGIGRFVYFDNGAAIVYGKGKDPRLPAGKKYAFQGHLGSFGKPPYNPLTSWTLVAEPEIVMTEDRTIVFDARKAGRIDVRTQRTATDPGGDFVMEREIPGKNGPVAHLAMGRPDWVARYYAPEVYTLAGGQATTGTFRHVYSVHKEQPPIRLLISDGHGRDGGDRDEGAEFLPAYPSVHWRCSNCTARQPRFPASAHLPLVDVGAGSTEEIAAAKVAGKLALLRPPADAGDPGFGGWSTIDAAARRIADAGAAGIVVAPTVDGGLVQYSKRVPIPTAVLSFAEGTRLAALVAADHPQVRVTGVWPSPYTYDLVFTQKQGLTNGAVHHVDDGELARVTARYHGAADAYYLLSRDANIGVDSIHRTFGSSLDIIPARTVRTEMVTPDVPFRQSRLPVNNWGAKEFSWAMPLPSGGYEMNVGSGPWVAGAGVYSMWSFLSAGAWFIGPGGRLIDMNADRNETSLICEPPACEKVKSRWGQYKVSDGVYKVVNDQAQSKLPLSVRSHTEWKVNVHVDQGPPPGCDMACPGTRLRQQPAIQTTWYVDGGLDNVVPTGKKYTVRVVPSYGEHDQTHGKLTARLWATYDDGQTWAEVSGEEEVNADEAATFELRTPKQTNGFVGYRTVITDEEGNAIDQTVIRAAYTRAP